jgi:hypothetical protein
MFVNELIVDRQTRAPVLILSDRAGELMLPICIGLMEASAIATVRDGLSFPRPLTHDLFCQMFERLGATLDSVEITEIRDTTFHALLCFRVPGSQEIQHLDSRPSDAIAIALRFEAPIWVREEVLASAGVRKQAESSEEQASSDGCVLEDLEPEDFGKYKM